MRRVPVTSLTGLFLLVQPLSPAPSGASAQEPSATADSCSVQVAPDVVDAGLSAVEISVRVSRDIGTVQAVRIPPGSGIALASPERLARIRAGADEVSDRETIRPIVMGPEPNRVSVWLNLFQAESGDHPFTLEGERGLCRGNLTVDG